MTWLSRISYVWCDRCGLGAVEAIEPCPGCERLDLARNDEMYFDLPPVVLAYARTCESCGGQFLSVADETNRCSGCGLVICTACTDAHEHLGKDGRHGIGDPAEYVRGLELRLAAQECVSGCIDTMKFGGSTLRHAPDCPNGGGEND